MRGQTGQSLANLSEFTAITTCIDYEEFDSYASKQTYLTVEASYCCP
ncbi:hypothetical protein VAE122_1890003 [Vibrio aestuarianus]|nr:hypothetical protein VAE122_1890003 [Vibrio aestuarianus]